LNHHPNREAWLYAATDKLRPLFAQQGYTIPECRISCRFPSTGVRSGRIGECWSRRSSRDNINQIFISPALEDPVEVLDTLVHELVHAVDDCQHMHGKEFKKIALRLGLQGPMRSTKAGVQLKETLKGLAIDLGPYPHGRLSVPAKELQIGLIDGQAVYCIEGAQTR
jgi:hypothetical protein